MITRKLEVSVISDIHLATYACKAKKILKYLKSISPEVLVLNGDIFDSWRFSRNFFPKAHLKVVRQFIKMLEKGVKIFYITGNHDEFLRKFNHTKIGNLQIVNQLVLELNGQKTWIFHGDIFDHIIHQAKWLAKLGAASYGLLTVINNSVNIFLKIIGFKEMILYKSVKQKLVREKPELSDFEQTVSKTAAGRDCQTVICGHTHVPKDKLFIGEKISVRYINCGDWIENFTAAEYDDGKWSLFHFNEDEEEQMADEPDIPDNKEIFQALFRELALVSIQ
ncbi:MAG: UDP-2,3-diacylglucosamine diphosphatase [Mangrovibacterium sp.]|jgi:UDP-2,3-diacylglucosamine pyrophosphatase LpxH